MVALAVFPERSQVSIRAKYPGEVGHITPAMSVPGLDVAPVPDIRAGPVQVVAVLPMSET